ncbi:hypothetical protein GN244_ATG19989 [Phytophthora infestans]|uniref:Uncharacterized protein n=1 Tax=Phytophthora infestans TaxID=4787 RepID=A0A833RY28_PHYIN|nr:hypothetical protein GN244_ATG19989 [Phytophthora infestans]
MTMWPAADLDETKARTDIKLPYPFRAQVISRTIRKDRPCCYWTNKTSTNGGSRRHENERRHYGTFVGFGVSESVDVGPGQLVHGLRGRWWRLERGTKNEWDNENYAVSG